MEYEFDLIEKWGGYNSSSDATRLEPNLLVRGSKNVTKMLNGNIGAREGIKRRGSVDFTEAGVKSSFEWETSVGTRRHLRVSDGKLEVESDILVEGTYVWYELFETDTLASLPTADLTRLVFDAWWANEEKADRLLFVRGDDNIFHWSGGMAVVESSTADTITKTGTETWAELGFTFAFGSVSGSVTSISISNPGTGYIIGDIIALGGVGSGATVRVTNVGASGLVSGLEVTSLGFDYVVAVVSTTGGSGSSLTVSIDSVGSSANAKGVIIDGQEYLYTGGQDTTTLNGVSAVSGDASTITPGSVAIQSVEVGTEKPFSDYKADFIKVVGNQLWVGSYTSRIVWISSANSYGGTLGFLLFTQNGTLVSGDPDAVVLDGTARGIGVLDGKVIIFSGESDMYVITPNDDLAIAQSSVLLSGGSSRAVVNRVVKKKLPGLQTALGHEFIDNHGDYLVWLDRKNQVRALGTFTNNDVQKPAHVSLPLQDELEDDDFTGGHLRSIGDTVHITAPNSGRDYMYQIRETIDDNNNVVSEKIWQPPQIRGIARFAIFNGVTHGHSNVNPQAYQIFNTDQWHDDHPSEEAMPYTAVARLAYRRTNNREDLLTFTGIFFEGYTYDGVPIYGNIYFDYQGVTASYPIVINSTDSPAEFYFNNNPPSLGDSSFGDNPLGDGIIPEGSERVLLPKFRKVVTVNPKYKNCFEYQLEVYTLAPDSRWEILTLGPNVNPADQNPTFLAN